LGLTLTSVYVPNGKTVSHADFPLKLGWLDALAAHLREAIDPAARVIVAGDFNLVPADLDSYDGARFAGHIFHTEAERARYAALLDLGLVDLYREKDHESQGF